MNSHTKITKKMRPFTLCMEIDSIEEAAALKAVYSHGIVSGGAGLHDTYGVIDSIDNGVGEDKDIQAKLNSAYQKSFKALDDSMNGYNGRWI